MYMNDQKVGTIAFNEQDQIGKVDFAPKINELYKSLTSKPSSLKLQIKIENYKYNAKKQGFHLSYLIQADYNDKLPPTAPGALFAFTLTESTPLN